jgi:hypothetical protein
VPQAQEDNPTWIANEVVFAHFGRAADLRMPNTRFLRNDGRLYFGSEMVAGRDPLRDPGRALEKLTDQNRDQLTRAVLLGLALLNSDRTAGNTLIDSRGAFWFYDHDKALWGDGRPAAPANPGELPGDLGRLNPSTLGAKFADYLGDYLCLRFPQATDAVFAGQNWSSVVGAFKSLPLSLKVLAEARHELPGPSWLSDNLFSAMETFLPIWWKQLGDYFDKERAASRLLQALREQRKRCEIGG